jgi:hypothetical protein
MEKFNIWKVLALFSFIVFVGCASKVDNASGTGDAASGAGTGTGGTTK